MQLLLQKEEAACAEVLFVFYQNSKSQETIFSYFSRDVVEIFKLLHSRVKSLAVARGRLHRIHSGEHPTCEGGISHGPETRTAGRLLAAELNAGLLRFRGISPIKSSQIDL